MVNLGRGALTRLLNKNADGNTLLNVKDVGVPGAIGTLFLFLTAAVQVKNINVGKTLHKRLAHPSVGNPVDVRVVSDEGEYPRSCLLNSPLPEPNELDEVVIQIELLLVETLFVVL